MTELKEIDYKILFELMKNSKTSDRSLAKKIGVSQPTITRRRARLEKEVIEDYTTIPNWDKLGYQIFALTFVKIKMAIGTREQYEQIRVRGLKWLKNQPNIIMSGSCRGIGVDSFMISIHKTYAEYDDFLRRHRLEIGDLVEEVKPVIVNLAGQEVLKPLSLKYLADASE
ncbi:MAG: Lrp/AsnC family transcriptional regulator [Candidatus Bathyarchaeota archaeon]|nr:Lrp/AsnC family transcriptional regulator [Candidatus Bathyarchaeota archaeon]